MKLSEIQQIIKEEIRSILKEEAPKPRYKKGDTFAYRGIRYNVISDDGYVVKVVDKNGKEAMLNYNQLNQGVFKKPDYLNEAEEGVSLENLPTYNDLPETDKEVPRKDMRYIDNFILVPSIVGENGFLYSKEKAKKWLASYKKTYKGEEPKFTYKTISIAGKDSIVQGTLVSAEYLAHQKRIKDYEESPEYQRAVQSFYDSLKYKGD